MFLNIAEDFSIKKQLKIRTSGKKLEPGSLTFSGFRMDWPWDWDFFNSPKTSIESLGLWNRLHTRQFFSHSLISAILDSFQIKEALDPQSKLFQNLRRGSRRESTMSVLSTNEQSEIRSMLGLKVSSPSLTPFLWKVGESVMLIVLHHSSAGSRSRGRWNSGGGNNRKKSQSGRTSEIWGKSNTTEQQIPRQCKPQRRFKRWARHEHRPKINVCCCGPSQPSVIFCVGYLDFFFCQVQFYSFRFSCWPEPDTRAAKRQRSFKRQKFPGQCCWFHPHLPTTPGDKDRSERDTSFSNGNRHQRVPVTRNTGRNQSGTLILTSQSTSCQKIPEIS